MPQNYIEQLRAILRVSGWTQVKLAKRVGVTHAALSRWLHRRAAPHPKKRSAIAALYKAVVGFQPLTSTARTQVLAKANAMRQPRLWARISRNSTLLDELLLEHTYNSNAIEGSTLSRRETEAVIFDKGHLPNKSLVEHLEAANHAAVLRDILQQRYAAAITETLILQLHKSLLQGIREDAGRYATHPRAIRGLNLALTHPKDIQEEMRGLLAAWRRTATRPYTAAEVASFHADFELIHPFGDGNGRVGRLIMLMQCLARQYPPVVIETTRKAEYYEVLEHAQRHTADPLTVFLVDEMARTTQILRKHLGLAQAKRK